MDIQEHVDSILWRDLEGIRKRHGISEEHFRKGVFLLMVAFGASHSSVYGASPLVALPIHHTKPFQELIKMTQVPTEDNEVIEKTISVLDEICSSFGIGKLELSRRWLSSLQPALHELFKLLNSIVQDELLDWLKFVDSAYLHTVSSQSSASERATSHAIEIGINFIPRRLEILSYFQANANFAVRVAQETNLPINLTSLAFDSPVDSDFLGLRLALHGIRLSEISATEIQRSTFAFVSHPTHFVSRKRIKPDFFWQTQENIHPSGSQSALEALAAIIRYPTEIGVAAIPVTDCHADGWKRAFRRHLITEQHLLAVIGGLGIRKTDKQMSYWIFSGRQEADKGVVFINLESLAREENEDAASMLRFAAKIVRSAYPRLNDTLTELQDSTHYNGLWSRHFESRYQDVAEICRLVNPKEFDGGWSLDIGKYVSARRKVQHMLRLLDSRQVMDFITQQRTPQRAYVIGPNGQGKSLLLAQLAEELADQGIRTAGISFGLTDRFVFSSRRLTNGFFSYLGARTSETTISLPATRQIIEDCVRAILGLSKRLAAFRTSMSELGFDHLYIIPSKLKIRDGSIPDDKIAEIIKLTESDVDEGSGGIPAKFSLAVVRQDSGNRIVPLEKLSSGEQQLITLIAKLCAYAEPGWVMLIDEPEISLHVSWQRAIPPMLAEISKELQCSMVVATHSPILFASALPNDLCFTAENQVCRLLERSRRISVESALFDDFGTYTPNTRRVHELCAAAVANTMRTLNSEPNAVIGQISEAELAKLEKVKRFVDSAPMTNSEGRTRDMELIRQTRLAIEELLQQHTSNPAAIRGDL